MAFLGFSNKITVSDEVRACCAFGALPSHAGTSPEQLIVLLKASRKLGADFYDILFENELPTFKLIHREYRDWLLTKLFYNELDEKEYLRPISSEHLRIMKSIGKESRYTSFMDVYGGNAKTTVFLATTLFDYLRPFFCEDYSPWIMPKMIKLFDYLDGEYHLTKCGMVAGSMFLYSTFIYDYLDWTNTGAEQEWIKQELLRSKSELA